MTDSIIFVIIFGNTMFFAILVICTLVFRAIIEVSVFNGIGGAALDFTREFIKTSSFNQKLFMTYIWKCNPTGNPRLIIATWFLICHYIHAIATITFIIAFWIDVFTTMFFDITMDMPVCILSPYLAYGHLFALIIYLSFLTLPVSLVLGIPIHLFTKNRYKQTIRVTRMATTSTTEKSGVYKIFVDTESTATVRIRENETKGFKVRKGNHNFWVSCDTRNSNEKFWVPYDAKKSNDLYINVYDSIVELEVGCDINNNLWIRRKEKKPTAANTDSTKDIQNIE